MKVNLLELKDHTLTFELKSHRVTLRFDCHAWTYHVNIQVDGYLGFWCKSSDAFFLLEHLDEKHVQFMLEMSNCVVDWRTLIRWVKWLKQFKPEKFYDKILNSVYRSISLSMNKYPDYAAKVIGKVLKILPKSDVPSDLLAKWLPKFNSLELKLIARNLKSFGGAA